jgi:hypothetical protein
MGSRKLKSLIVGRVITEISVDAMTGLIRRYVDIFEQLAPSFFKPFENRENRRLSTFQNLPVLPNVKIKQASNKLPINDIKLH